MVNYNIAHSKMAHKYLFKVFYNKINKKKYNFQIWLYSIRHTDIIVIKDIIILEKTREKEELSGSIADKTMLTKVVWVLNLILLKNKKLKCKNSTILKKLGNLLLNTFSIFYKRLKDRNNKNKDLKAKIYYMAWKTILKHTYYSFFFKKIRRWWFYSTSEVFKSLY